jgi:hypothetical protein
MARGHRGGVLLPHRSIHHLALPKKHVASGLLITLSFTLALVWLQPWIAAWWGQQLVWWMHALPLPGQFVPAQQGPRDLFVLVVPMIDVQLRSTHPAEPAAHALVAISVWVLSGWLPDSARPAAFLLRLGALIHGAAVVYFQLWPASFPHSLMSHTGGGLRQSWALMVFTPWLHLCTFYLFPFTVWQRLGLTALTLMFLFLLAPLQYASHAALLYQLGLIIMPLLHLLFGVMVPILGFVALYGWGMSWRDPASARLEA